MKKLVIFVIVCFLFGCISPFEPKGIEQIDGILVVEGIITDGESVFTLSRSRMLSETEMMLDIVTNANVFVEREDGTLFPAELSEWPIWPRRYHINNGPLDPNSRYRLRIDIPENNEVFQYFSEFAYPIITPEIDRVFWTKRGDGQPVTIHVETHSPEQEVLFYRWSFRADWEINSDMFHPDFPFRCWGHQYSREILLGSAENTVFGRVIDIIHEINPRDQRLSVLYRIEVTQNAISRRAHTYFENIRRNAELTGSIFSPTPSTMRGNIFSATDPNRHVVGYVDVSTTTQKRLYIRRGDGAHERVAPSPWCSGPMSHGQVCFLLFGDSPAIEFCNPLEHGFVIFEPLEGNFILQSCVDCTFWGTTDKPYDWPI